MTDQSIDAPRAAMERLVSGFREHLVMLRDPQTLEAVVRQEYIDPFWAALGWDVSNREQRAYSDKDVVVEAPVTTLEIERSRIRRPDYLFRTGGFAKFVVEAKKPAIDIRGDKEAIFQAKTYAWSAQIPFAILMDFEEFLLFDATLRPYYHEPSRGLIEEFALRFDDYPAQWDVLLGTFGREAVASGSLEALLARVKKVRAGRRVRGIDGMLFDLRGTEPVDRVFLSHLEDYRLRFAKALYEGNQVEFSDAESLHGSARLTEATQRLVDRLVFLRVCEDRGIVPYGGLRDTLNEVSERRLDLYDALVGRFREFDTVYNGYLFKAHFTERLTVPGEVLADFIRTLYPPEGAYRFDAIADDLLGIIYERFLGSAIHVAKGRVGAEEKPEVRHAGGVYYTPKFVVDSIVRRVVGPLIDGKSPSDVLQVTVLDPACGSGSFLIGAYQFLIDHCTKYFSAHPAEAGAAASKNGRGKRPARAFQDREGQWHLAPDFRTRLLTSCMHGVDIDAQAVEVTIMSLYLKALEGKLPENWQRQWIDDRLLPPLDNNVRCGNSLLSQSEFDDFWDEKHGALFAGDDDVRFRINAFDWTSHTRGFGRVFAEHGGFDCIIGNPPYIRVQELNKWAPDECEFYKWRYRAAAKGNYDIYVVFIERALELLRPNGLLGFICPHKYWQATYGAGIRKLIADGQHLQSIIDFTDQQVFRGATTYTAIQVFSKRGKRRRVSYALIHKLEDGEEQCKALDARRRAPGTRSYTAPQPATEGPWAFHKPDATRLMEELCAAGVPLSKVVTRVFVGLQTSADDVFLLRPRLRRYFSEAVGEYVELESRLIHPLLKGSLHIRRWLPSATDLVVLFPYERKRGEWRLIPNEMFATRFPKTWKYLLRCRKVLAKRERGRFDGARWYGYVYPKNLSEMASPKILTPSLARRAEFALDEQGKYFFVGSGGGGGGGYGLTVPSDVSPHFLVGLLNSRLLDWYVKHNTTRYHSGWYAYNKQYIEQVPIKLPKTRAEEKLAERITERVRRIVEIKRQLQGPSIDDRAGERWEREVEAHEGAIDALVLELYGVDELPED